MGRKMNGRLQVWLHIIICVLIVLRAESCFVDITYVHSAVPKGGVCLDGSPPAYHLDKGSGTGINNWLIHIEGGGWCNNVTTCLALKQSRLGSSNQMAKQLAFFGIISKEPQFNPDFYNWNRVVIRYCDGSSFTGDIEAVDPSTRIYYRGARVFVSVIEDLLAKGMKNGKNVILNGCSAGGLATIFHCDRFKALLPESTKVKCFSDGGLFINVKDVSGAHYIEDLFDEVVATHGSAQNLPESCTSKMKPSLCFFPQHVAQEVETPMFFVNAAYDAWQIRNIWAPGVADPHGLWDNCKNDIRKCSTTQLQFLQEFRLQFLNAFSGLGSSPSRGYFINSCYAHCQTEMQETWFKHNSPMLNNKTIARAFGDWFFDRSPFQKIDCAFPCDKTCNNLVFPPKNHSLA